jgi:SWI2/SNF2 ATPase-like protein
VQQLGAARSGRSAFVSMVEAADLRDRHKDLLDLVRHFALFMQVEGRTIKVAARYQQFRAVRRAVERLLTGKTRKQDGEHDRRGGIVWHTQGSGKSLTMVFLVRKIRTTLALRRFKVVVVTDRKDLEKQLSETAALTGQTVTKARFSEQLKAGREGAWARLCHDPEVSGTRSRQRRRRGRTRGRA